MVWQAVHVVQILFVVLFLLIIHFTAIRSMDKVENDQLLYL